MCGIAVARDLDGRGRAASWALQVMRHRGPDGAGTATVAETVLDHRRLAIIDPHNREADQPMRDASGRWTLAYNGEVFNQRELRSVLEGEGVRFRTNSDTEVVLEAFARWGTACLPRLRGMFAFAIHDGDTDTLYVVRDQIGVKPFYWWTGDGMLVGASEVRTLIANPAVRTGLDPAGVASYLSFGYAPGEETFLEGVRVLPPGSGLVVDRDGIRPFEFWDPIEQADATGPADLELELAERLEAAVTESLVSDVPVSMMLSGGVDSSLIAALAARAGTASELTAYSVSFGLPNDESAAAKRLADDLGLRHCEIELHREAITSGFDDWLASMDVPSANPTWLAVTAIARAVHEDGGKVLLSGDGGDELFGGYDRWIKYLRFHDRVWARSPSSVRRAAGTLARPLARGLGADIARRAREGGELFVGSRPFHDDDLAATLGPVGLEAASESPPERAIEALSARYARSDPDGGGYLRWMSYASLRTHLAQDYLARLDKMGMSESVEGRVPLLDPRLAELSYGLPQDRLVPGYEQKALLKAAARRVLPPYVFDRPKQGFCPPITDWAYELIGERFPEPAAALVDSGIVRADAMGSLRKKGTANAGFALWTLGTLSAWCETNL